jgi:hypothetical protein
MTWRDKLEIGLKENAPYRKDNLPESEVVGPELPQGPGRSPEIPDARETPVAEETTPPTRSSQATGLGTSGRAVRHARPVRRNSKGATRPPYRSTIQRIDLANAQDGDTDG